MPHRRKFFNTQDVPLNILVVDGSESYRAIMHSTLMEVFPTTSRIDTAASIAQSRKYMQTRPYDCVLLDINLSNEDGTVYFDEIRNTYPHIAIMVMTSNTSLESALDLLHRGAEDCLVKGELPVAVLPRSIRYAVERRFTKNETERLSTALRKEQQLGALQREFISLVTHEFKTPLAIIHNATQMVGLRLPEESKQLVQDRLGKIGTCITRLTHLIDTVVLYSKVEEGHFLFQPQPFDFSSLLQDMIERYSDLYGAERLVLTGDTLPKNFFGDRQLCEHILANIISNALKYSPQSKVVRIEATSTPRGCGIRICDQGVGMKNEELQRMGEKFFRSSRVNHITGSGLGMHLAHRFMEYHGGTIYICSAEGEGTSVDLHFPIKQMQSIDSLLKLPA